MNRAPSIESSSRMWSTSLERERDCLLGLKVVEDPGHCLKAEAGLSVIDVPKFVEASCVKLKFKAKFESHVLFEFIFVLRLKLKAWFVIGQNNKKVFLKCK